MKKLVRVSMIYMITGLFFGVFYREMTKIFDYEGPTQLAGLHTHTFTLGMLFFLIVLLLEKNFHITQEKNYKKFYAFYQTGLGMTLTIMLVHGTMSVMGYESSPALSGIAGLGHISLTIGLGFLFNVLFSAVSKLEK
ncbi:DUF2871 domain-containing protein [Vagococcus xieshaowenii]|uniref:DUF2871 domain-containing protein n=1 Tax=Vagococcus xieshaowenii TaxID=2562451 RepID=A0AAJ5EGH9_9ENTE|nr:DUF2871 domain-containing protein [Vagococcus xieshaowenii]QCA28862.1 DUF2871 domain-containing protein [Vagococcus xieshaowenii]TFZ43431.1 DUF2871 domain-containing protein [Vagococcus xieshaowenii]